MLEPSLVSCRVVRVSNCVGLLRPNSEVLMRYLEIDRSARQGSSVLHVRRPRTSLTRWLRVSFSYKKLGYALAMFAVAGLRFESRVSLVSGPWINANGHRGGIYGIVYRHPK